MATLKGKYVGADAGFIDTAAGDFRLKSGTAPFALGFIAIPMAEIWLAGKFIDNDI